MRESVTPGLRQESCPGNLRNCIAVPGAVVCQLGSVDDESDKVIHEIYLSACQRARHCRSRDATAFLRALSNFLTIRRFTGSGLPAKD